MRFGGYGKTQGRYFRSVWVGMCRWYPETLKYIRPTLPKTPPILESDSFQPLLRWTLSLLLNWIVGKFRFSNSFFLVSIPGFPSLDWIFNQLITYLEMMRYSRPKLPDFYTLAPYLRLHWLKIVLFFATHTCISHISPHREEFHFTV